MGELKLVTDSKETLRKSNQSHTTNLSHSAVSTSLTFLLSLPK